MNQQREPNAKSIEGWVWVSEVMILQRPYDFVIVCETVVESWASHAAVFFWINQSSKSRLTNLTSGEVVIMRAADEMPRVRPALGTVVSPPLEHPGLHPRPVGVVVPPPLVPLRLPPTTIPRRPDYPKPSLMKRFGLTYRWPTAYGVLQPEIVVPLWGGALLPKPRPPTRKVYCQPDLPPEAYPKYEEIEIEEEEEAEMEEIEIEVEVEVAEDEGEDLQSQQLEEPQVPDPSSRNKKRKREVGA